MGQINEKQLEELFGKVGFIVNLSQMIEYTLANILAFDELLREFNKNDLMCLFDHLAVRANKWYTKLSKQSFGYGLRRAQELDFFTADSQERLQNICEERNFVIHHLFKDDLKTQHLETDPSFYFERLESLIEDMYQANEDLNEIFKYQKAQFKKL